MRFPWQRRESDEERDASISFSQWLSYFSWNGVPYAVGGGIQQSLGSKTEEIGGDYQGLVQRAYKGNGVVFACCAARMLLFSEARFQFRQMKNGRPGNLFGTQELGILERPWPNGTTGDLLSRVMQDNDLAGNFYAYREFDQLHRLRPDWVRIILASRLEPDDPACAMDAEVAGYAYYSGGYTSSEEPTRVFLPGEVAHVALIPDPSAHYRGMSWLSSVLSEIMADESMTRHKQSFMDNGATPNLIIKTELTGDKYDVLKKAIKERHEGTYNAYKTLVLSGGADATVVGANFQQVDFKVVQGAGETRIAAAARTPPALVGLSEGLQGSSLNAGNYSASRRNWVDGTIRPYWRNTAASFAPIVNVPLGAELWYDDRDIPYLREDTRDLAQVMVAHASAVNSLITTGFEADYAVQAITTGDYEVLIGHHNGLPSVQQQPSGAAAGASASPSTLNGGGAEQKSLALLGRFMGDEEE